MKSRLLFLVKFLGCSAVVFFFRHPLLEAYSSLLEVVSHTSYRFHPDTARFVYESSMTMLTFVVLMIATPGISAKRRVLVTLAGLGIFMIADLLSIQYLVFPRGVRAANQDSLVYELYLSGKWLLPFFLWVLVGHRLSGDLFGCAHNAEGETEHRNPSCRRN